MGQPIDDEGPDAPPLDDDERLGEAIESYLELAERGEAPPPDAFAARYGDLEADVRAALEGLELVHGLVGGAGSSPGGAGPGRNLESGRRIAGYRVVRELGRGGMGTVYEAVHVGLDRPVALKVLGTLAAPDSSARRRFLNEARVAAGLHHTHIVPVFDVGQVGGLCYYAMQRIEGSGLDRVVRWLRRERGGGAGGRSSESGGRGGGFSTSKVVWAWARASSHLPWNRNEPRGPSRPKPLPLPPPNGLGEDPTPAWSDAPGLMSLSRTAVGVALASRGPEDDGPPFEPPRGSSYFRWAARVGLQAAEALAHAHQHGVIHRDVKPSNLLIDSDGSIWVADFGLARRLADPGLTQHDGMIGTPRYMSPEQGRAGVVDGRTDVYSLGATLYELITLRPPFDGASAAELLDQIAGREPASPRSIDPRIPRDLETIVLKSLAKRPADRYATAGELAADLARFLNREPVKARRISLPVRAWRVVRRHPGISSVTAAASLIILAVAAFAYHRVVRERDAKDVALKLQESALQKADEALVREKASARQAKDALRTGLWHNAELVRRTDAPDRRTTGLGLLKQAAGLDPDAEMKARLRDEAVEFLALREVEPRVALPTGPTRDVVLGAAGARLIALTNSVEGEDLAFWDVACRRLSDSVSLGRFAGGAGPRGGQFGWGPFGGGGSAGGGQFGRGRGWWGGDRLTSAGSTLAVAPPGGGAVLLLDQSSGALIRELKRPGGRPIALFGEPTGKRLAVVEVEPEDRPPGEEQGSREQPTRFQFRLALWDLEHPEEAPRTLDLPAEGRRLQSPLVAFSADGKTMAAMMSETTTIRLFAAEDGRETRSIESPAEVRALALGAESMLAAASEGTIQLWNLASPDAGGYITGLTAAQGLFPRLQFNPQGTLLASAASGAKVDVWDVATHKLVAVLSSAEGVTDVAFSGDGRAIAAAGPSLSTSFWQIHEPSVRTHLGGAESRRTLSASFRDDGLLALADAAGDVWLWRDAEGPAQPYRLPSNDAEPSQDATREPPSPRGSQEAMKESQPSRGEARAAGPEPASARRREPFTFPRMTGAVFTAAGDLAVHDAHGLEIRPANPSPDRRPERIELATPQTWIKGDWVTPPSWPLVRSADGRTLALIRGRSVHLWDSARPDRVVAVARGDEPFGGPHHSGPHGGDAGRRRRPGGGPDGGGPIVYDRQPPGPRPKTLQISPAGDRIYILPEEFAPVQVWALSRSDEGVIATPEPWADAPEGPWAIALSPDGGLLAVVDRSRSVVLIDAHRLVVVGRIAARAEDPETMASALAFAPGGRLLAVGSQQGAVRIWDVEDPDSPRPALRLPGEVGRTVTLAFRPDGRRLAVAGSESAVEIWNLAVLDDELARLGLKD